LILFEISRSVNLTNPSTYNRHKKRTRNFGCLDSVTGGINSCRGEFN